MYLLVLLAMAAVVIAILSYRLLVSSRRLIQISHRFVSTEQFLKQELETQEKMIVELAELKGHVVQGISRDTLTELPSRQMFQDRVMQIILQSRRFGMSFAILFLDLDGFKLVNNVMGHTMGDLLLKEVAIRLQASVRQVDSVSRFGGDEFVLLLAQVSRPESAAFVAQRILASLADPFLINDQEIFISASIGISVFPGDGGDVTMLLKNADNALQQAKKAGCNTYKFYREEMQAISQRSLLLSNRLRSDEIYQELSLFYQPQIDVELNKVVGVEALLRWQHPDLGLILPAEFIRFAEDSGKIVPIGDWILRQACKQFQVWKGQGFDLDNISVNVALRQLENPRFIFNLTQILQETKVKPESLILEISEGNMLGKIEVVEKSLHMLKRLGVRVSIDNFGTGHLSLQHLRRFPMNRLKIDRTLIEGIVTDPEAQAIVKMIIMLADTLSFSTVAEGVENEKQKQLLTEMGCFLMQGYLYSPAVPPREITALLTQATQNPSLI